MADDCEGEGSRGEARECRTRVRGKRIGGPIPSQRVFRLLHVDDIASTLLDRCNLIQQPGLRLAVLRNARLAMYALRRL